MAAAPEAPTPANLATAAREGSATRFHVLDGLRGIAAFAVIVDHTDSATLRYLVPGRHLAVDFFFVLSGFVLAHAYGKRLTTGLSAWAFMRARVIRLYPLYLLGLCLGLVVPVLGGLRGWGYIPLPELSVVAVIGLFFLPTPPIYAWSLQQLYPLNGPAWSLFFELVANLVYGLVARFLTWRVFAVILPICAVLVTLTLTTQTTLGPGWLWPHFAPGLARVLYCFFAGVMIYKLRIAIRIPAIPLWLAVLALGAILAAPVPDAWRQAYDALSAIVLLPLLVALASGASVRGDLARVCVTLGLLSYGVYVLHVPLLQIARITFEKVHFTFPDQALFVVFIAVLAALVAAAASRWYDAPIRRWLAGRTKRPTAQIPAGEES